MKLYIDIPTTRSKSGKAKATISRYKSVFDGRPRYTIQFYRDFKAFTHHKELRDYVMDKYKVDIGDREQCWGL